MDRSRRISSRQGPDRGCQEDRQHRDESPGDFLGFRIIIGILTRKVKNAPAYVWFIGDPQVEEFVQESKGGLPKTASGKVQKHILRAWSKELASKGYGKAVS